MVYFMCFQYIYGLENKNVELKAGQKIAYEIKSNKSLTKDNRFLDCVEFKLNELIGILLNQIHETQLLVSKRKCEIVLKIIKI